MKLIEKSRKNHGKITLFLQRLVLSWRFRCTAGLRGMGLKGD